MSGQVHSAVISGRNFTCAEPTWSEGRKLQLRAVKVLSPALSLMGLLDQEVSADTVKEIADDPGSHGLGLDNLGGVLAKAVEASDPDQIYDFIHFCCSKAYNAEKKRFVNPEVDFSPYESTDIEVALFVLKVQCGPFIQEMLQRLGESASSQGAAEQAEVSSEKAGTITAK